MPIARSEATNMSYLAQLLPYLEQTNLRDLIDEDQHWSHDLNNIAELTPIPAFQCPSTLNGLGAYTGGVGNSTSYISNSDLRAHYVGIMGAKSGCPISSAAGWPDVGYTMGEINGNVDCTAGGTANNGVIVNVITTAGSKTKIQKVDFKRITDGTSNTMMVGEQSWEVGPTRTWIVGDSGNFIYNAKNVMWPMNVAYREEPGEGNASSGYSNNDSSLGSMHPAGAHVLMADSSVQFQAEDTELNVLKALATRGNDDTLNPPAAPSGGGVKPR